MEFPELGKQCSFSGCQQLDFLPFTCTCCQLTFCKEHHLPGDHDCANRSEDPVVPEADRIASDYYPCSTSGCSASSLVAMPCIVCQKHFCLAHRHHGCLDKPPTEEEKWRWARPREQFAAAKQEADRQVDASLSRAARKKSATALKVQLMRLKGRAQGPSGVPTDQRVYFLVLAPERPGRAAFVSREWALGRAVDSLAEACRLPNHNSDPAAPKLRLFRRADSRMLDAPSHRPLMQLMAEGALADGETLVLEYVPGGNVQADCLVDPSLYAE